MLMQTEIESLNKMANFPYANMPYTCQTDSILVKTELGISAPYLGSAFLFTCTANLQENAIF